ncbi:MAG TPA: hypothetical protein VF941_01325 [Clostridia bacterium]
MFFLRKKKKTEDTDNSLALLIREDLKNTFNKKGIDISQVDIDINLENLSIQVFVKQHGVNSRRDRDFNKTL